MKKLILGAVLMFASFAVSAASVSITPTAFTLNGSDILSSVQTNGLITVGNGSTNIVSRVDNGNVTGQFSGDFLVQADTDYSVIGDMGILVNASDDWALSIFQGTDLIGEYASTITGFGFASGFANVSLIGQQIYKFVLSGSFTGTPTTTIQFSSSPNLTETPLPAAVWLFGSVLLGGLAMRRRSQKMNVHAVAA